MNESNDITCTKCGSKEFIDIRISGIDYIQCRTCKFYEIDTRKIPYEEAIIRIEEIQNRTIESQHKKTLAIQIKRFLRKVRELEDRVKLIEDFNITDCIKDEVQNLLKTTKKVRVIKYDRPK